MAKFLQKAAETRKRVREEERIEVAQDTAKPSKAAAISAPQATKKSKRRTGTPAQNSSIVYLGRIPHGFYEKEMFAFFKQFGNVVQLKLYRSLKTNGSKGYAFIKFETPEIATVVADAMDGYFIMDKQLVCHVVPTEKVHDGLFKVKKAKSEIKPATEASSSDAAPETAAVDSTTAKKSKKGSGVAAINDLKKKQSKLAKMGFDYTFTDELLRIE